MASSIRALLAALLLSPIAYLAVLSLTQEGRPSLDSYAGVIDSPAPVLLARTLGLAACSTLVAFLLGGGAAIALESRRFPGARAIRLVALAPLLLPPAFQVAAWEALVLPGGPRGSILSLPEAGGLLPGGFLSIRSLPFAGFLLGLSYSPLAFYFTGNGVRSVHAELVEAASLARRPAAVWFRVILPLGAPCILAGAGIVFTLSLLNYEVPRLLDVVTYPVVLTLHYGVEDSPGRAFAAAAPILVLSVALLVVLEGWAARRGFALAGRESPDAFRPRRRPGPLAWAALLGWLGIAGVLPLLVLIRLAGGAGAIVEAVRTDGEKVLGSAAVVLVAALAASAVAAAFLLPPARSRRAYPPLLLWIPFAVPGVLLGFALGRALGAGSLGGLLDSIYDGPGILVIAVVLRFYPLALLLLSAQLRSVPSEEWEAAELLPGAFGRWVRVRIPLALPGLATGAVAVTLLASGELPASLFLAPPGHEPLMVRIYNLLHYDSERSALAALTILHVLSVLAVCGLLGALVRLGGAPKSRQRHRLG